MQDILKSIKAFLYERSVSPLFGAFVVAWLAWNYRVLLALFDSHATLAEKLSFLDSYFGDNHIFQLFGFSFQFFGGGHLIHGFLMPVFLTWLYLYVYPKIAIPVYGHSLEMQKQLKHLKQEKENYRLLTVEESRNLQKEIEQLRFKADEEVSEYRARISSLTQTINSLEAKLNSNTVNNSNLKIEDENPPLPDRELRELAKTRIDLLDDTDFEIATIYGNDWLSLNKTTKEYYENLFHSWVERGDFPDIKLIRSGPGVTFLYRKISKPVNEELLKYENRISSKFPQSMFSQDAFEDDKSREALLKKVSDYFYENKLSEDAFDLLLKMVQRDGIIDEDDIETLFSLKLSPIELDHVLDSLMKAGYILYSDSRGRYLSDLGKALVVNSGLTTLAKKLSIK